MRSVAVYFGTLFRLFLGWILGSGWGGPLAAVHCDGEGSPGMRFSTIDPEPDLTISFSTFPDLLISGAGDPLSAPFFGTLSRWMPDSRSFCMSVEMLVRQIL